MCVKMCFFLSAWLSQYQLGRSLPPSQIFYSEFYLGNIGLSVIDQFVWFLFLLVWLWSSIPICAPGRLSTDCIDDWSTEKPTDGGTCDLTDVHWVFDTCKNLSLISGYMTESSNAREISNLPSTNLSNLYTVINNCMFLKDTFQIL